MKNVNVPVNPVWSITGCPIARDSNKTRSVMCASISRWKRRTGQRVITIHLARTPSQLDRIFESTLHASQIGVTEIGPGIRRRVMHDLLVECTGGIELVGLGQQVGLLERIRTAQGIRRYEAVVDITRAVD